MQTSTGPVPLQHTDLDRAAHVLTRAFHDDPGIVWLVPNEGQRRRLLYWNHRKFLQFGLRRVTCLRRRTPLMASHVAPARRPMMSFMDAIRLGLLALPFKVARSSSCGLRR